ncbi:Cytochrome p450 [Globisporangium polare]
MLDVSALTQLLREGRDTLLTPGVAVLACAVALLGYMITPSPQDRAVHHLPTPTSTLPLFDNTLDFLTTYREKLYDFFLDNTLKQSGKMWRMKAMGRPVAVVLTTPEAFEHVLKTKFEDFGKGPRFWKTMEDLMGNGIFAVDGTLWMHQRKTASHLFSLQMMHDTVEQTVVHYTTILCERLGEISSANETVNFKRLLDIFTMDVFTKIGFGVDLNSLRSSENQAFLDAFERASLGLLLRFQVPTWYWQLKKKLNIGSERVMAEDIKTLNTMVYDIISRSMARRRSSEKAGGGHDPSSGRDLISLFLEKEETEYANGEQTKTDASFIRDMAVSFLAAGRDTTSQSMTWLILMLNRNPRVLQKVREELNEQLPGLFDGSKTVPSMEDVQQLTYLEAAIRESLRLNPVVGANSRMALRDTTLHDGTFIKKGTRVGLHSYVLGRLPWVWGDDACEYKPERWIDAETGKLMQVSPFKFQAFLGGPRTCIGMKFALMEMKMAMAAVLSKFEITTVKEPFDFQYRATLTMTIKGPVDVTITPLEAAMS